MSARALELIGKVGVAATFWSIYERSGDRWLLWHVAPTHRAAREVAAALARFTRLSFHLFPTTIPRPPSATEVIAIAEDGRRRTWGFAHGEWYGWQVRDALARTIGDAIRAGRATSLKPSDVALRGADGRMAYSNETEHRPF